MESGFAESVRVCGVVVAGGEGRGVEKPVEAVRGAARGAEGGGRAAGGEGGTSWADVGSGGGRVGWSAGGGILGEGDGRGRERRRMSRRVRAARSRGGRSVTVGHIIVVEVLESRHRVTEAAMLCPPRRRRLGPRPGPRAAAGRTRASRLRSSIPATRSRTPGSLILLIRHDLREREPDLGQDRRRRIVLARTPKRLHIGPDPPTPSQLALLVPPLVLLQHPPLAL